MIATSFPAVIAGCLAVGTLRGLMSKYYDGLEAGVGMDMETITSRFQSFANVERCAIIGAPSAVATVTRVMDKGIPVGARNFDSIDEPAAWDFVGAHLVPVSGI